MKPQEAQGSQETLTNKEVRQKVGKPQQKALAHNEEKGAKCLTFTLPFQG